MTRLIKAYKEDHFSISDQVVRDKRLSWKARGIFAYLWSQSNNWDFKIREIQSHSTDGRQALETGIAELKKFGYLKMTVKQDEKGRMTGHNWIISDRGGLSKNAENRRDGKPEPREPGDTENPLFLSNINNKYHQFKGTSKRDSRAAPDTTSLLVNQVVAYLNKQTGKSYRSKSKATTRLITARAKEGYKLDDFKRVIDNQVAAWGNDAKMSQYIRPSTLFRASNFENYLNNDPATTKPVDPYSIHYT